MAQPKCCSLRHRITAGLIALGLLAVVSTSRVPGAAKTPPPSPRPDPQSQACAATLAALTQKLGTTKDVVVWRSDRWDSRTVYREIPPNRSIIVAFSLRGAGAKALLQNTKPLLALSKPVLTKCPNIGAIRYGIDQTDWSVVIGILANRQVVQFSCVEPIPDLKLKWGQQVCL